MMLPRQRKKNFGKTLLFVAALTAVALKADAQSGRVVSVGLKEETMYALPNAQQWVDSVIQQHLKDEPLEVVMVFGNLPDAGQRSALQTVGIDLKDYLGDKAYLAYMTTPKKPVVTAQYGIQSIFGFRPSWKVSVYPEGLRAGQMAMLMVSVDAAVPVADLEARLKSLGGQLNTSPLAKQHYYEIALPFERINALAAWYAIRTISPAAQDQPLNFESTCATKTNLAHLPTANGGYGLLGDGMTIGVGDNNSGVAHVDLRDRIINYNPVPYTNHGQHINGIVGGAGTINPKGQGFAPHATLVDHLYNLVWARTGTMVQDHNMTVTNNSYTSVVGNCNFSGLYDAYSQALDTICLQYPTVLHVFAAGNDGSLTCAPYLPGFGTVTGSYQPAKNVLVVAQSDKRYEWGINSSRGPVKDGRLKPEITAIGSDVLSTTRGDAYLISGGTSMAAPQVAGAAALLQQRYKQLNGNASPTSDIIKTLLMNGAMDIGNPGPDFTFGFGMMDIYRSLQMLDNNRYVRNTVGNGAVRTTTITVPPNTAQLKVMLYWHEAPASVLAANQLINDLDLEVTTPAGATQLPFVLNAGAASVNDLATTGVDHLNNVEQVVVNNPAAGTYALLVKGSTVPGIAPDYVLAYDFVPVGVQLTYPATGTTVMANDSLRIYWDASPDNNPYTLEFSQDNGSSWTVVNNSIPAGRKYYTWYPANISSGQCKMRLSRNGTGQQFTTGAFAVNPQPLLRLSDVQCPGYLSMHWSPVPNATAYRVLRKRGPYLQPETILSDTTFVFRGLSMDSTYYTAVEPMFNAMPGYRSLAVSRRPDNGSCTGSISDGDIAVEGIAAPVTGRQGTSTALGNINYIEAIIHNLDDAAVNSYSISWQVNNGSWQTQNVTAGIPAGGRLQYPVPLFQSFAAPGTYLIKVAVRNTTGIDNNNLNDTIVRVVRQLVNAPLNLSTAFNEGFEDSPVLMAFQDTLGFTPSQRWDYYNSSDTGRLRTFVNSDVKIEGNRSVSMDLFQYRAVPVTNFLTGTFNLSAYNASGSDELRLAFDYKLHGISHYPDSNKVWVRGADTQPWRPAFAYDTTAVPGQVYHSGSISLNDLMVSAGQNFSSSTQIRFGQRDTTVIALNNYGTGITLDNVRLYLVQNDLALQRITSPAGVYCNAGNIDVRLNIENRVNNTISSATVSYQLDNGIVTTETLAAISGRTTAQHTFSLPLNLPAGNHVLKAWVNAAGDTYRQNDTAIVTVRNQPQIATFPYLEQFERGDGYWYSEGRSNSWAFGTPATAHVTNAASGTHAWKTNLNGYYNDNELSYLYSPCFSTAGLSAPMLSFSTVIDIENCGATLCDAGWVEYSLNNSDTWTKLGAVRQGYSWYNDTANQVWTTQGDYRWHVASIPLPQTTGTLRLRFVLASDPGTGGEGISIDDIHIFDRQHGIFSGSGSGAVTQATGGNGFVNFVQNNQLIAAIDPAGQPLGNTEVNVYLHPTIDTASGQYYLQRSFMVHSGNAAQDSVTARFYVLDAEVDSLVNAGGCSTCSKPKDAYRLGISKYDDTIQSRENGVLSDNITGSWTFYPSRKIIWVPYDSGYYAQVRVPSFSEFWFNDGGPQGNLSLPNYELGRNALLAVYPNPVTSGQVNIIWNAGLGKNIGVTLTTIAGQIVYQRQLASFNGTNKASLQLGDLSSGIYFLQCTIGDQRYTRKLILK